MVPLVTVCLPSISSLLGWLDISPAVKISCNRIDQPPDFHHVCLEGYGPHTTFKNRCARNNLVFGWQESRLRFLRDWSHCFFGSHHIRKRYPFNSNIPHKVFLQTLHVFWPILGIIHRRYQRIRVLIFALLEFTQKAHVIQLYVGCYFYPSDSHFMLKEKSDKLQVVFGP